MGEGEDYTDLEGDYRDYEMIAAIGKGLHGFGGRLHGFLNGGIINMVAEPLCPSSGNVFYFL